ncbi:MAG: hypothetical protein P9L91_05540 [Candidatus Zophobacter franzmannii]|nr:hypothetical protein [Candidatus Zophobacter franzmannii]
MKIDVSLQYPGIEWSNVSLGIQSSSLSCEKRTVAEGNTSIMAISLLNAVCLIIFNDFLDYS